MGHAGESLLESIERIIRSVLRGLSDDAVFECLQKREEMEPQSRVLADSKVVADLDGVLAAYETKSSANRPTKLPRTKSWLDKVETHVREVKCKKIDGPAPPVVGRDFSDIKLDGRFVRSSCERSCWSQDRQTRRWLDVYWSLSVDTNRERVHFA